MSWSNAYTGIPWRWARADRQGCDCAGLVRLVYAAELDLVVPGHAGVAEHLGGARDHAGVAAAIGAAVAAWPWRQVDPARLRPFDLAVFGGDQVDDHVGLVVDPGRRLMLHVEAGRRSSVTRYDEAPWLTLLRGIYRHRGAE